MNVFTNHPHSVGQTYKEHLTFASRIGYEMIYGGCCCLFHALCPAIFKHTASSIISMIQNRIDLRSLLVVNQICEMERENEDEKK